jgi:hypothetical protein
MITPEQARAALEKVQQAQMDVRAAIAYYSKHGYDWLTVVEFLCWRARQL